MFAFLMLTRLSVGPPPRISDYAGLVHGILEGSTDGVKEGSPLLRLWLAIFERLADHGALPEGWRVEKAKGHLAAAAVVSADIAWRKRGNDLADSFAKRGAVACTALFRNASMW